MAMTDISREYGTALFMLACEENAKKEYGEALSLISEVFAGQPEYALMLASPSISLKDRLSAITEAFGGRVPENVLSYVQLMCEKGRINYFAGSTRSFLMPPKGATWQILPLQRSLRQRKKKSLFPSFPTVTAEALLENIPLIPLLSAALSLRSTAK